MNEKSPKFIIKKVLDQGTSNPIVNRMLHQFYHILGTNCIQLDHTKINKIKGLIWECMNDLLKAEESLRAYFALEEDSIKSIMQEGGVKHQKGAYSFNDPTQKLKKHFEDFLIRCVIAIRRTVEITNVVFDIDLNGPAALKKYLFARLPNDSPHKRWINENGSWMISLYDLRGKVEHQELEMGNFEVDATESQAPRIKLPEINKPLSLVRNYIQVTFHNTFGYCEDMLALLLNFKCSAKTQLVCLPEQERAKYNGFKYRLILKSDPNN